jgi:hypothetical protein
MAIYLHGCQVDSSHIDSNTEKQTSDSLSSITKSFLRSWEPPFNPEKALIFLHRVTIFI